MKKWFIYISILCLGASCTSTGTLGIASGAEKIDEIPFELYAADSGERVTEVMPGYGYELRLTKTVIDNKPVEIYQLSNTNFTTGPIISNKSSAVFVVSEEAYALVDAQSVLFSISCLHGSKLVAKEISIPLNWDEYRTLTLPELAQNDDSIELITGLYQNTGNNESFLIVQQRNQESLRLYKHWPITLRNPGQHPVTIHYPEGMDAKELFVLQESDSGEIIHVRYVQDSSGIDLEERLRSQQQLMAKIKEQSGESGEWDAGAVINLMSVLLAGYYSF